MKKVLSVLLLVISCGLLFGQSKWEEKFYVDSFGDPTEKAFLTLDSPIQGVFSNSATTDSLMFVMFIASKGEDTISFKIFEYGYNNVNSVDIEYYDVKTKDIDNNVLSFQAMLFKDRFYIVNEDYDTVVKLFKTGDPVKFMIRGTEYNINTIYNFKLDSVTGFKELY